MLCFHYLRVYIFESHICLRPGLLADAVAPWSASSRLLLEYLQVGADADAFGLEVVGEPLVLAYAFEIHVQRISARTSRRRGWGAPTSRMARLGQATIVRTIALS